MKKLTIAVSLMSCLSINVSHADTDQTRNVSQKPMFVCQDFTSQMAAQKYFDQLNDEQMAQKQTLDADHNGQACDQKTQMPVFTKRSIGIKPSTATIKYTRGLASRNTILSPMPTAMVLMKTPKNNKDADRALAFCKAYKNSLADQSSVVQSNDIEQNMISTRWLVEKETGNFGLCSQLVSHYDFKRAQEILETLELAGNKGPFLVAIVPGSGKSPSGSVVVDLSSKKDKDFNVVFSEWQNALEKATNEVATEQQNLLNNQLFSLDDDKLHSGFWSVIEKTTKSMPIIGTLVEFVRWKISRDN